MRARDADRQAEAGPFVALRGGVTASHDASVVTVR